MSTERRVVYPVEVVDYADSTSGTYLSVPLPSDIRSLGIDDNSIILWEIGDDGSNLEFLRGTVTDEKTRMARNIQPGGSRDAEFIVTIPRDMYRPAVEKLADGSPFVGLEKGDQVVIEVKEGSDPEIRLYKPEEYTERQVNIRPEIRAPIIGGTSIGVFNQLKSYACELQSVYSSKKSVRMGESVRFCAEVNNTSNHDNHCSLTWYLGDVLVTTTCAMVKSNSTRKITSDRKIHGKVDYAHILSMGVENGAECELYVELKNTGQTMAYPEPFKIKGRSTILSKIYAKYVTKKRERYEQSKY